MARATVRPAAGGRRQRQHRGCPASPFGQVTVQVPEAPQGADDPQPGVGDVVLDGPAQRGAQVLVVDLQDDDGVQELGAAEARLGVLDDAEEPLRVPALGGRAVVLDVEPV